MDYEEVLKHNYRRTHIDDPPHLLDIYPRSSHLHDDENLDSVEVSAVNCLIQETRGFCEHCLTFMIKFFFMYTRELFIVIDNTLEATIIYEFTLELLGKLMWAGLC